MCEGKLTFHERFVVHRLGCRAAISSAETVKFTHFFGDENYSTIASSLLERSHGADIPVARHVFARMRFGGVTPVFRESVLAGVLQKSIPAKKRQLMHDTSTSKE